MAEAVEVVVEDVVIDEAAAAAAEAAEDAEFDSGFAGAPTVETPPADEEVPPVAAEPAEVPAPEVKYRQITEDEWTALQATAAEIAQIKADNRKELDRAFGKVGGVERTLAALQAATPSGYTVDVTDDIVADLQKEFPELGGLTLKAFKSFAGKLKGTAPAATALDPQQLEAAVSSRLVALQTEALEEERPGWRETVGAVDSNTPYRQWLKTQPAEYQTKLVSTNSAAVISKSISKFEADAAKAAASTPEAIAAAKAAAAKLVLDNAAAARKKRLAAADTPKGAGGHSPTTAVDDFEAGFKSG